MKLFQRAASERDLCKLDASIRIEGVVKTIKCKVINLSVEGAGLIFDREAEDLPEYFFLTLPIFEDCSHERAVQLRWRMDRRAGVKFAEANHTASAA